MEIKESEFNLTNENYHSAEARHHYMGVSLYKEFKKCEVMGLAKANGQFEKTTDALLFGSYVDAYFSGELDSFIAEHPELFTKQGTLKSEFKKAEEVIKVIEEDEEMMKYLNGEKQVIMIGEIAGVPWKIKIDAYHPGKLIVDQKVMKDMEDVWIDGENGRRERVDFVSAYGYDLQGASYQEIVRQNTGQKLPFVLAITTKEDYPDKLLLKIDQEYLDECLEEIKAKAPRYWDIINGKETPVGCGHCPACRSIKKIKGVMSYKKLFKEREEM